MKAVGKGPRKGSLSQKQIAQVLPEDWTFVPRIKFDMAYMATTVRARNCIATNPILTPFLGDEYTCLGLYWLGNFNIKGWDE